MDKLLNASMKVSQERTSLPAMKKPCHDCAVVTGMYKPISDALATQPEHVITQISQTWECHNNITRACAGNIENQLTIKCLQGESNGY